MPYLIYIISFLEGFTTLSIEIIAIRNFTPIVGTNSISTSVILGVILLALSYGYYIGGKISSGKENLTLIKRIILNLCIASFYYFFITFLFDKLLLNYLLETLNSYFFSILITSFLLFFLPVFFASQTIPLLSEVLKGENTGEKIGKLLFFSTIGSFLGSVLTSSLLFSTIGVSKSATLNSLILAGIAIILSFIYFRKIKYFHVISILLFLLSFSAIIGEVKYKDEVVFTKSNSYQNILVYNMGDGRRLFSLNNAYSSGIDIETKESFFSYIKEIKEKIIKNKDENIAIIGAAGFTLPHELSLENNVKNIDVVDVDPDLKDIAEKYFLEEDLNDKVNFKPIPSRYFLNDTIKNGQKYDSIVVDVYVGKSLPPQTLTYEFFENLTKVGDNIFINLITDRSLTSNFSKKAFNTMNMAFGNLYYKDVNAYTSMSKKSNFVITNKYFDGYKKWEEDKLFPIYTDDKNFIELDLFKLD